MTDSNPLCPTCHSKISPTQKQVKDADGAGIPAWSDDPAITPNGFNGPDYTGSRFVKASWIKEIQDARKTQETDAGVSPPTEFTSVEKDVSFLSATQITELRISTERILDAVGSTLEDYFKLDADGNVQPPGPNDVADKKEWTHVSRGTAYSNQGKNLTILQDNTTKFLVNATTPKDTPTVLKDITYFSAILLEDLRHPLQTKAWLEAFSQEVANNSFNMSFYNLSPDLNLTSEKVFEGSVTHFIGDMANPNVDINDNPYFIRQTMAYQPAPIHVNVQIPAILTYTGTLTGVAKLPPDPPNPELPTPISYRFTGGIPGIKMINVGPNPHLNPYWEAYNVWQVISPPRVEAIKVTYEEHVIEHRYQYGVAHQHIILISNTTSLAGSCSGNRLTQHYSEGGNWNNPPWKFWYTTTWNHDQAYAQAAALISSLPDPVATPPVETGDDTHYDARTGCIYYSMFEWDLTEYSGYLEEQPLEYLVYADNDTVINSGTSNFADVGEPFVVGSAIIRPWDFVPNHPEITPTDPETGLEKLSYGPVGLKLANNTAIRIILSEKSYQADGITPEANPVSNAILKIDLYVESPKVPEIIGPPLVPEEPEKKAHLSFNISGPGTIIEGKKVFTIYLDQLVFDPGLNTPALSSLIGRRCYFSIGLTPQITTRLSQAWHDPKWDQAVPSSAIPGEFWGTTTFVNPRGATGTITIDSVAIKKILRTTGLVVTAGDQLTAEYQAGTINTGNNTISIIAGSVEVMDGPTTFDERTNYVEANPAGVVSSNITGFSTGSYPLAIVVAKYVDIISVTDKRE
jgi:hypothetical protein